MHTWKHLRSVDAQISQLMESEGWLARITSHGIDVLANRVVVGADLRDEPLLVSLGQRFGSAVHVQHEAVRGHFSTALPGDTRPRGTSSG